MRQGLGGVTAWAIDLDDFNNRCCAEPSPLLRAAGRALGRSVPAPGAECERPPQPVTPAPPTTTTAQADGEKNDYNFYLIVPDYALLLFCALLLTRSKLNRSNLRQRDGAVICLDTRGILGKISNQLSFESAWRSFQQK